MSRHARNRRRSGQAIVMVALALAAMCGLLGLAVDLGWSFFVKKAAQAAADAAAIAAVEKALVDSGGAGNLTCGLVAGCQASPASCSGALSANLASACQYAQQNGFRSAGRQEVTVQADTTSPPPTAPGVQTYYWVTVRASETIPQLFSAVLGNANALVGARATAGIVDAVGNGSLIMLNHENDGTFNGDPQAPPTGINVKVQGTPTLIAPGGIYLASRNAGAGTIQGSGTVNSPWTRIRGSNGNGGLSIQGGGTWQNGYQNQSGGFQFQDPMRGKGQPPLTSNPLPAVQVPGGALNTTVCPGGVCPPGNYFATGIQPGCKLNCVPIATGAQINAAADLTFSAGGNTFGDYHFFGGLRIGQNHVTFGPGRYVMAGTNNPSTFVFDTDNKALISGGNGSDAGRLFLLTDSAYPGLAMQIAQIDAAIGAGNRTWSQLNFAPSGFRAGNNAGSGITLYGLDKSAALPADTNAQGYKLKDFAPTVIWQDQRNSNVVYTPNGNIDTSCYSPPSLDTPCTRPAADRHMEFWANQRSLYSGVVYQPRGAWLDIQAASGYRGPLQLISGSLGLQGSGTLQLDSPLNPFTVRTVALVE